MPLKFAANLSMMFKELATLSERYVAARDAGFKYVEMAFPYEESVDKIAAAKADSGLEQILINSYPGDLAKGELGLSIFPDRVEEFKQTLEVSIHYAKRLGVRRMHILAGKVPPDTDESMFRKMENTFISNLTYAANRLQQEEILALTEAVNSRVSVPTYFLGHPHKALSFVKQINHPNLKVQFDFFHVQIMDGNITQNLKEQFPYIGHIQISQVPDRGEPDENGEICFPYIFQLLEKMGYSGFVGCEYIPRDQAFFQWFKVKVNTLQYISENGIVGVGLQETGSPAICIDGTQLKVVDQFKYLGITISSDGSLDKEITAHISKASQSMGRLHSRLLNHKNITLTTKIKVFKAVVLTSLHYGCETWTPEAA